MYVCVCPSIYFFHYFSKGPENAKHPLNIRRDKKFFGELLGRLPFHVHLHNYSSICVQIYQEIKFSGKSHECLPSGSFLNYFSTQREDSG